MIDSMIPFEKVEQYSDQEVLRLLYCHCDLFYKMLTEVKFIPEASAGYAEGVYHSLSGAPHCYHNYVRGVPSAEEKWDETIQKQLAFFHQSNTPFIWCVDESESQKFRNKLVQYGFQDGGILQGVIGNCLDMTFSKKEFSGIDFEPVKDIETLKAFNGVISKHFGMNPETSQFYEKFSWEASQGDSPKLYHWVAKKGNEVIATISSLIEGEMVSLWNGATVSAFRRQGISTALVQMAIEHAIAKGCTIGMSYLMAECLALGISRQLGAQVRWRFHAFCSPAIPGLFVKPQNPHNLSKGILLF